MPRPLPSPPPPIDSCKLLWVAIPTQKSRFRLVLVHGIQFYLVLTQKNIGLLLSLLSPIQLHSYWGHTEYGPITWLLFTSFTEWNCKWKNGCETNNQKKKCLPLFSWNGNRCFLRETYRSHSLSSKWNWYISLQLCIWKSVRKVLGKKHCTSKTWQDTSQFEEKLWTSEKDMRRLRTTKL